ncbi:hypothetical protein K7432_018094 [Basidiobolus ranarum]|uniref:RRM domain-containing protein n=1 Tax=Basidiobolus ranarum TaxID=34480 RepID=A0ABR2WCK8_9FUNG
MFAVLRNINPSPMQKLVRAYATKNIFVGNLSNFTTAEDLESIFGKYGKVGAIRRPNARYGFVEMEGAEAEKAAKFLNGHIHSKHQWSVKLAKTSSKRDTYAWSAKKF